MHSLCSKKKTCLLVFCCFIIAMFFNQLRYLEDSKIKVELKNESRNESKYIAPLNRRCNTSRYSLLIGVRKGGTRALIDMIGMHSKVHSASNEMHFFDLDENYNKGYSWYQQKMPSCKKNEIVKKNTQLFRHPYRSVSSF